MNIPSPVEIIKSSLLKIKSLSSKSYMQHFPGLVFLFKFKKKLCYRIRLQL